ncbi:hypothetical protein [Chitinibacter sp. ZOR0017]|uniref:hypothetical protein n=1 Tax=Chitinibacter sp. ZOR0017 TaxID=1339254 RepID=UPI00064596E7|nr:hypothetical protein [Chitinibacter sp. ZOR0017]
MGDDARGNLIEKQQGAQVQKLAWDGFNRLAALETPNGKTVYAYAPKEVPLGDDVFGRHIGKRHNGQTTTFVWDGNVIALEKTAEQTRHYLFEAGSFVPLAQVVEKDGGSNTGYYHVDHLGMVIGASSGQDGAMQTICVTHGTPK